MQTKIPADFWAELKARQLIEQTHQRLPEKLKTIRYIQEWFGFNLGEGFA
jgi:hypothetical protein